MSSLNDFEQHFHGNILHKHFPHGLSWSTEDCATIMHLIGFERKVNVSDWLCFQPSVLIILNIQRSKIMCGVGTGHVAWSVSNTQSKSHDYTQHAKVPTGMAWVWLTSHIFVLFSNNLCFCVYYCFVIFITGK